MVFLVDPAGGYPLNVRFRMPGRYLVMAPTTVVSTGATSSGVTGIHMPGYGFCVGGSIRPLRGINGYLWTSKAFNKYGDKECEHVSFEGYLFPRLLRSDYFREKVYHESGFPDVSEHDGEFMGDNPNPAWTEYDTGELHQYFTGYTCDIRAWNPAFVGFLPIDVMLSASFPKAVLGMGGISPIYGFDCHDELKPEGWYWHLDDSATLPWDPALYAHSNGSELVLSRTRPELHWHIRTDSELVRSVTWTDEMWRITRTDKAQGLKVDYYEGGDLVYSSTPSASISPNLLSTDQVPESALVEYFNQLVDEVRDFDYTPILSEYKGKLIRDAIDNCRALDINSTAYLRDVKNIWSAVKPIFDVITKPASARNWANLWLTYRYGIRLFINDSIRIMKAWQSDRLTNFPKFYKGRSRKMVSAKVCGEVASIDIHLTIKGSDQAVTLEGFFRILRQLDLVVGLSNMWDLLPYSFVLDWLVPIQETLAELDRDIDLNLYDIRDFIWSTKTVLTPQVPSTLNVTGNVKLTHYKRWREDPNHSLSVNPYALGEGVNVIHSADALALAIQRKHK